MRDTTRDRVAALCDRLAERTGDPRFRAAADALRAERIGRPRVDDTETLRLAGALLDAGMARSRDGALRMAALMRTSGPIDAAVRRLRRKADETLLALDR